MIKVIKRDGRKVDFDENKIIIAIEKAMKYGSNAYDKEIPKKIATEIQDINQQIKTLTILQIEELVYNKLIENNQIQTAKAYEGYRAIQEYKRENNTIDESILGLLNQTNKDVMKENSNKNPVLNSTLRDLFAGEVSKDLVDRKLYPPHIVQAHADGIIHLHDKDYLVQKMHNCCIIGLEDMLSNGTTINGKQIATPNSFQVASTVTTQVIAQITSSQYGGASINGIDRILAPYVRKSYEKYYKKHISRIAEGKFQTDADEIKAKKWAWEDTEKEVKDGVQTIQYQINTLSGSNGYYGCL